MGNLRFAFSPQRNEFAEFTLWGIKETLRDLYLLLFFTVKEW